MEKGMMKRDGIVDFKEAAERKKHSLDEKKLERIQKAFRAALDGGNTRSKKKRRGKKKKKK